MPSSKFIFVSYYQRYLKLYQNVAVKKNNANYILSSPEHFVRKYLFAHKILSNRRWSFLSGSALIREIRHEKACQLSRMLSELAILQYTNILTLRAYFIETFLSSNN